MAIKTEGWEYLINMHKSFLMKEMSVCAEHDIIYFVEMTEDFFPPGKDSHIAARLENLGLHFDEDACCWATYV